MTPSLASYEGTVGAAAISQLRQLARSLAGARVVHVNSTRVGGGVAEILEWLTVLMTDLGLETRWEVIEGVPDFFHVTKSFHNGLQGKSVSLTPAMIAAYERTVAQNAERLRPVLEAADFVIIHDPQPARLLALCPDRRGKWVWRCHIDASRPYRPVWKYLREQVAGYDASIFSMPDFAHSLPHPQFVIAPSIDPLSEKNRELPAEEVAATLERFGIRRDTPLVTQVSRFDRFKDPLGVIEAFRLVRQGTPVQFVLAGGGASDDPEGAAVLDEVRDAAADLEDLHVLLLPGDAHRTINALQRGSTLVMQKSLQEGFGLTVTEAMWKGKPVIGGDAGGIRLQVHNHHTGFLVNSPEGAALRVMELLQRPERIQAMGATAQQFVREHFLLTRHLREYLTLLFSLERGFTDRLLAG